MHENERSKIMQFGDISEAGMYSIVEVSNSNGKFTGLGILPGNTVEVVRVTKHLIHFRIHLTDMFARRNDIDMRVSTL